MAATDKIPIVIGIDGLPCQGQNTVHRLIDVDGKPLLSSENTLTVKNKTLDNTNIFTIKDGNLTFQNSVDPTKQALFLFSSITTGQTNIYTFPNVSATILTQTGANANTYIPFFVDAFRVQGTANFIYNGSRLSLEVGGTAPVNTTQGIGIFSNTNNRALSISGTSQTTAKVMTFDNNNGSDNSMLNLYGTTYVGNLSGTSIPLLKSFEIANGGSTKINPLLLGGSRIYLYIGNTSTNMASVQDAVGLRIGLMSDIHTTNLNPWTVQGKSYFGANTAATETLQTNGNIYFDTLGMGIKIKSGTNGRIGAATLASGTILVPNSLVTANSRIFVMPLGSGTGTLNISAVSALTSFTISSSSPTDARTVWYWIVESV